MKQRRFSIAHKDEEMLALMSKTNQKTLAIWAIDCAERVLHYFEEKYPEDPRPKKALKILQEWIDTGKFSMKVIRKASLDAHAAAREVGEDSPARAAARATGQAVATAHAKTHSYGAAIYAQQAIHRATKPSEAGTTAASERDWQFNHLLELEKPPSQNGSNVVKNN